MELERADLKADLANLLAAADDQQNAVGQNWDLEENISDARRLQFEACSLTSNTLSAVSKTHFEKHIEGSSRAHLPSTFDASLNSAALLPATIEDTQKVVRLERIDQLLEKDDSISFDRLIEAVRRRDEAEISAFAALFGTFPGSRPAFAAFKAEVDDHLKQADWLQLLIKRLGLLHNLPRAGETFHFALMEYTVGEVRQQAAANGLNRPFALATVLESRCSPAFFTIPSGAPYGFTVNLDVAVNGGLGAQEFLHARFDYLAKHVIRLAKWAGPTDVPNLGACRERHINHLRSRTGQTTYGDKYWPMP